jgi:hypothetical protein
MVGSGSISGGINLTTSIVDIFKAYKNKADGDYNTVATEYANLDIEWIKKNGNQTISANTSWGNSTNDARNLLVLVDGNLTINSGCTLTAAARKRGMFIWVNGDCTINGTISMTSRGAVATGQRLLLLSSGGNNYEIPAVGGAGAPQKFTDGGTGYSGTSGVDTGACGGGGGGAFMKYISSAHSGAGGNGTSYSGGAASGGCAVDTSSTSSADAPNDGGAGTNGYAQTTYAPAARQAGGGAGNPGGSGATASGGSASSGSSGTGGLLVLYVTGTLTFGASGILTSVGSAGGNASGDAEDETCGGGGSGGGHIDIFYKTLSGSASYDVSGGAGGVAGGSGGRSNGGAGGAGSTRATEVSLPNLMSVVSSNFFIFF